MIVGRNLAKIYGKGSVEVRALDGVDIDIAKGEFVGITGASGSGKSTLLHLLGLLDRPTAGTLLIDGMDVGSLGERARALFRLNRLGYVFQDYALVPELTAEENIYLPSKVRGMTIKECTRACRDILSLVGLKNRVNFLPGEMSGGEQQRVAIARALVNNPAFILADEPCANLDTRNSTIILELIRKLNKELNQTVVMVSHEEWHQKYFDRVIVMQDGKIVSGGEQGGNGREIHTTQVTGCTASRESGQPVVKEKHLTFFLNFLKISWTVCPF